MVKITNGKLEEVQDSISKDLTTCSGCEMRWCVCIYIYIYIDEQPGNEFGWGMRGVEAFGLDLRETTIWRITWTCLPIHSQEIGSECDFITAARRHVVQASVGEQLVWENNLQGPDRNQRCVGYKKEKILNDWLTSYNRGQVETHVLSISWQECVTGDQISPLYDIPFGQIIADICGC